MLHPKVIRAALKGTVGGNSYAKYVYPNFRTFNEECANILALSHNPALRYDYSSLPNHGDLLNFIAAFTDHHNVVLDPRVTQKDTSKRLIQELTGGDNRFGVSNIFQKAVEISDGDFIKAIFASHSAARLMERGHDKRSFPNLEVNDIAEASERWRNNIIPVVTKGAESYQQGDIYHFFQGMAAGIDLLHAKGVSGFLNMPLRLILYGLSGPLKGLLRYKVFGQTGELHLNADQAGLNTGYGFGKIHYLENAKTDLGYSVVS